MIAAVTSSEGVIAIGAAGVRKIGSSTPFTISDKIHLGSCTKAMTAAVAATLAAEGKLHWETMLAESIPELKTRIHQDYLQATLWELLTHRAGIRRNPMDWNAFGHKEIRKRRLAILMDNLNSPPRFTPGKHHYSNFGYMIAACMLEKVSGFSWESLIKKRLFEPLGMSSAGFGAPNTPGRIDQPWGHDKKKGRWQPDQSDNGEALGPAGRVHCSVEDWAKFLALFLKPEKNGILPPEYMKKLVKPVGHYAGGWGVVTQEWARGIVLSHNGSNGIWYATVMVVPKLNRAFIVATNSMDFKNTASICNRVITKLIKLELRPKNN